MTASPIGAKMFLSDTHRPPHTEETDMSDQPFNRSDARRAAKWLIARKIARPWSVVIEEVVMDGEIVVRYDNVAGMPRSIRSLAEFDAVKTGSR